MRRLARAIARAGQDTDIWPIAFAVFALLIPAACLLWFMNAAMRNERLAERQRLADAYRLALSSCQARLDLYWEDLTLKLETKIASGDAPAAFAKCVESGIADSVLVFDREGRLAYPNSPVPVDVTFDLNSRWHKAREVEFGRRDVRAAAEEYRMLAVESTNVNLCARALQAQARCLARVGDNDAVVQIVNGLLGQDRYRDAVDAQGRVIVANAELMVLQLFTNKASPVFRTTAERLRRRLADYENAALASPQRRFLMKEWAAVTGGTSNFPTLAAEELAATVAEQQGFALEHAFGQRAAVPGVWQFAAPSRAAVALFRSDALGVRLAALLSDQTPANCTIRLLPPGLDAPAAFVSMPAGDALPGWQLALSLTHQNVDDMAKHRTAIYLWTGVLVIVAITILGLLMVRLLRRQMALARLKNELAATVSHELKTPLSSMRLLVDTLLDSDKLDEQRTREYLELIAQENKRLGRLVQNFLAFSRMERKSHALDFTPTDASEIIESAIDAMRERFHAPGCHFESQIEPGLPMVMADGDAVTTALINLLDNAWKYSGDIKQIALSARTENGKVLFCVRDNGVGIPPHETRRIFTPFYQVDRRLSRARGGCGLGLSIVRFIAVAHRGEVSVDSVPGRGSTFIVSLPCALNSPAVAKEVMA